MRNFDIIKDIDGLETIHRYCAIAEDFQATNPMISVQQARLALETMVKTVYRLKGWQIGERASLLSLTADERFTAFVNSEDLMKRIHYVRKIGNNAAHANDGFVGRRESFFAVLNLYYIVGSIMLAWQVIDTLTLTKNWFLSRQKRVRLPLFLNPTKHKPLPRNLLMPWRGRWEKVPMHSLQQWKPGLL